MDIRTYICTIKKKKHLLFSIRSSFSPSLPLSPFLHFLALLSPYFLLVLLSSSFVDIRTTLFFFVFHCLVLVVMRKERERRRKLYNSAKCLCVCALIDYIFCLSKNDAENACFAFSFLMLRNFFFRSTS